MVKSVSEILQRFLSCLAAATAITATAPLVLAQENAGDKIPGALPGSTADETRPETGARAPAEDVAPRGAEPPATSQKQEQPAAGNARGGGVATESGIASIYASDLEGNLTASGERYDSQKLTAAHRSLPLGSRIRVTDPASGRFVRVVVNDRWGGGPGQVVNLSRRAADVLGMQSVGQRKVEIELESLGDGRRHPPQAGGLTPQLLPVRIEASSNSYSGRARSCANEADILGLHDVLLEVHVRNCLGRKPKSATAASPAAIR